MTAPAFSILIPTYNRHDLLLQTIESVLAQDFEDFEVIVADDCSTGRTREAVDALDDKRIRYFSNRENLGYGRNLSANAGHATGEILFLLGHDDILFPGALIRTYEPFAADPEVVLVTRPYYWFVGDVTNAVRAVFPIDPDRDARLSLFGGREQVHALFQSVGQLSGLAFRRSEMRVGFHHDIFPAHIYPVADIMKRGTGIYLRDFTVAIRMDSSMTRYRSEIYDKSPTATWMEMFDVVYGERDFQQVRDHGRELILAHNFEGLFQLRNYAGYRILAREVAMLIRLRPRNILSVRFWLIVILCALTPRPLLVRIVDAYKRYFLAPRIEPVATNVSKLRR